MARIFVMSLFVMLLSACGAPQYTVQPISQLDREVNIVVVDDRETRAGFLQTIEAWLQRHDYRYEVVADGSRHDLEKLTLEYVGHWTWDMALYLEDARIDAFYGGQRVGEARYEVPEVTASPSKFGKASLRIDSMMNALFAKINGVDAKAGILK
ncbi:Sbal_3080 family lipoprotein [Desulfotalea psychrophila]|uniref:Sbal_3080 family lipoprotein n=1 Tax=Desulfotalea psychrophila TaxID=84980 RepID=UPI0015665DA4|nr:Sbal_3080 family lipoprotein [Desulfotalea psychrophila]